MVLKTYIAVHTFAETLVDKDKINIPRPLFTMEKLQDLLTIVFGIIGGICLIILILGGIHFITSQGDPQATNKARNTIISAAIGLAISVAAFSIVAFVVGKL